MVFYACNWLGKGKYKTDPTNHVGSVASIELVISLLEGFIFAISL
jgi:hypothetical protein